MQDKTNFNICPKCGAKNILTAKFCCQCGEVLNDVTQPILCKSCNTLNPPLAKYCTFCGKSLAKDAPKTCPRCHNLVHSGAVVCDKCHFRLPLEETQTTPSTDPLKTLQPTKPQSIPTKTKYPKKALFGNILFCVLSVMFLYFVVGAKAIIPNFLWDSGVFNLFYGTTSNGLTTIIDFINTLLAKGTPTLTTTQIIAFMVVVSCILTAIMTLFINLLRIINSQQVKKCAWWYLAKCLIISIALGYLSLTEKIGVAFYVVPIYCIIIYALSFIFVQKKDKVQQLTR